MIWYGIAVLIFTGWLLSLFLKTASRMLDERRAKREDGEWDEEYDPDYKQQDFSSYN